MKKFNFLSVFVLMFVMISGTTVLAQGYKPIPEAKTIIKTQMGQAQQANVTISINQPGSLNPKLTKTVGQFLLSEIEASSVLNDGTFTKVRAKFSSFTGSDVTLLEQTINHFRNLLIL